MCAWGEGGYYVPGISMTLLVFTKASYLSLAKKYRKKHRPGGGRSNTSTPAELAYLYVRYFLIYNRSESSGGGEVVRLLLVVVEVL